MNFPRVNSDHRMEGSPSNQSLLISPSKKLLGIISEMSPRQMVDFNDGKQSFGIEGYDYKLQNTMSPRPSLPRSKAPTYINMVMLKGEKLPGVGMYSLRYQKSWAEPDESQRGQKWGKQPRLFESQILEIMS